MKKFTGFEHGMGIGGWLTNYKRFNVLPDHRKMQLTIGDYEHFRTYITESDIQYISSLGMDHIRLGFDQIVLESNPCEYREEIFLIIENFIKWCMKYDLNVVLNLHKAIGNYCDIQEEISLLDSPELQERFVALWVKIENYFSSYSNVAFELLNEVRDVNPEDWNALAAKTISAIRKINNTRKIILGGTHWNNPAKLKDMVVYDDENIIYTFHTYEPFSFTHQRGVLQADPLFYNRKMPYPGDIEMYRDYERVVHGAENPFPEYNEMNAEYINDSLQGVITFMENNPDKIIWCGEFGTIRHADIKWRENWMRDVISFFQKNNIPYCVWNYLSTPNDGNRFSLVDDDTRQILSEEMAHIICGKIS